jgi:hypothetical protein
MNGSSPAFPVEGQDENGHRLIPRHGLTKREYFAGLAMQGLLSQYDGSYSRDLVARAAVENADDLLAELEKEATK